MVMNRRHAIRCIAISSLGIMLTTRIFALDRSTKPFHFIGLGGAGSRMVEQLYNKGIRGKFTIVNDTRNPELTSDVGFIRFVAPEPDKVMFGHKLYGVTDIKKDLGIPVNIKALVGGNENFVILAGLGRYTGSYLSMKLSGMLHQGNKDCMVVTTLPFSFEGKHTRDVAMYAHQRIRANSKHLTLDLNDTIKEYGTLGVQDAFRVADEKIVMMLRRVKQPKEQFTLFRH